MKNMKISSKLYVILLLSLASSLIIVSISIYSINNLAAQTKYINEFMVNPLNTLVSMQSSFDTIRIKVRDCTINSDISTVRGFEVDANTAYNNLVTESNNYLKILQSYNVTSGDEYKNISDFIKGLPELKKSMDKIIASSLQNNLDECANLISNEFVPLLDPLVDNIDSLARLNSSQSVDVSHSSEEIKSNVLMSVIIVMVVVVIVLSIVILYISRLIVKPINQMVEASNNLADGKLDMSLAVNSKDETGMLARSIFDAVNTINRLISELDEMAVLHEEKGETDYYVDANKYKGAYGHVVKNVNRMVSGHIDSVNKAMNCLSEMAGGDFESNIEKFPGKKAAINNAVDNMRKNIKGVGLEINELIKEVLKGNLSVKTNPDHFKGGWAEIMLGLNQVLTNITEPVLESSRVLQEVSKGNLSVKVKGNFKGDLALLSNALNSTTETLSTYISDISYILGEIASANLNLSVTREYVGEFGSIKKSMNTIITQLNEIIGNIISPTEQVSAGARSISESSMTIATGATEQASSVQELSATIETINEKTNTNAENANTANNLSENSKTSALAGDKEMQRLLESMNGIESSSNNISKIIKTIDDIAFQTNLLALNAAVEAARAGEHGKGFAVVAEEVRTLAGRSQIAARETAALIEDSISRVTEGTRIAKVTAESLHSIVNNVNEVSTIISGIAKSSSEQANAISQITIGINQISEVVQSNSATSEETASASEELSSQADVLSSMVARFKLKQ